MSYLPLAMRPLAIFPTNNEIGFMKPKSGVSLSDPETFDGYYCTQNKFKHFMVYKSRTLLISPPVSCSLISQTLRRRLLSILKEPKHFLI